ncbi:hypothetical protein [Flavilitoribacter nigricans]|uniref:Uncharacterized protein n=1 Tax=Flavilitoribacter nigricans (strain ATCC 23147 / DSM 23189 / NBRC 102662 / NCIMB 1420 / SS-2) TaxID=1122177 RepID=A0A2D0NBT8_FLAN2|nr:hypothetical protein [Flavilitoribacter nigricans]PHN05233.1 hypothetical protein CRP01_17085 [Flavilitoribacter nigricans DSM 23189 = NBRC 102662]
MITRLTLLAQAVSRWLVLLAMLVSIGSPANASPASETDNRQTVFDLLYGQEIVDVTLETDMVRLMENIKTDNYQSAIFTFNNKQGESLSFQAEIRSRGNFRRRVCDFPPIKIKFPKEKLVGADIKPHNKLKLVTHCLDDRNAGQENLLKEYLAYKLYQELTDQSYRVQLVRISYEDTKGKVSRVKRYAIILEDTDEMAERLGGEECDCLNPQKEQLDLRLEGIHAMYQYMIGNEDWSIAMNRNLKMVKPLDGQHWKPVPYDFDFSGLVNASYALPNTQMGLRSIQDRLYLGMPIADTELEYLFEYFRSKRGALVQIVEDCKFLSRNGRNEVIDYLESFYLTIDQMEDVVSTNMYQAMSSSTPPLDGDRKGMNSGK